LLIEHIDVLRAAFRQTRMRHPFTVEAAVILPGHLHAIWTRPEDDADFARRRRLIKSAFSRGLPTGEPISASRAGKNERGIWQRRYWEHTPDEDDFARHLDYILGEPLLTRDGLVDWRTALNPTMTTIALRPSSYSFE
jgi:putative transposase